MNRFPRNLTSLVNTGSTILILTLVYFLLAFIGNLSTKYWAKLIEIFEKNIPWREKTGQKLDINN